MVSVECKKYKKQDGQKLMPHYEKRSIKKIPESYWDDWKKNKDLAKDPLGRPTRYYFEEAQSYRLDFSAFARTRIESIETLTKNEDVLKYFKEPHPNTLAMHILYSDFSEYKPTLRQNMVHSLGVPSRKANDLINNLIKNKVIISQDYKLDNRTKILTPTVNFVVAYERKLFSRYRSKTENTGGQSIILTKLSDFDALRKHYFPREIFKLLSFKNGK